MRYQDEYAELRRGENLRSAIIEAAVRWHVDHRPLAAGADSGPDADAARAEMAAESAAALHAAVSALLAEGRAALSEDAERQGQEGGPDEDDPEHQDQAGTGS